VIAVVDDEIIVSLPDTSYAGTVDLTGDSPTVRTCPRYFSLRGKADDRA